MTDEQERRLRGAHGSDRGDHQGGALAGVINYCLADPGNEHAFDDAGPL